MMCEIIIGVLSFGCVILAIWLWQADDKIDALEDENDRLRDAVGSARWPHER